MTYVSEICEPAPTLFSPYENRLVGAESLRPLKMSENCCHENLAERVRETDTNNKCYLIIN